MVRGVYNEQIYDSLHSPQIPHGFTDVSATPFAELILIKKMPIQIYYQSRTTVTISFHSRMQCTLRMAPIKERQREMYFNAIVVKQFVYFIEVSLNSYCVSLKKDNSKAETTRKVCGYLLHLNCKIES